DRAVVERDEILPGNTPHRVTGTLACRGMVRTIEQLDEFTTDDGVWIVLAAADPVDGLQLGQCDTRRIECRRPNQPGENLQSSRQILAQHIKRRKPSVPANPNSHVPGELLHFFIPLSR